MTIPPAKISDWTLEAFCAMQHQQNSLTNGQDYLALHPTSIDFLKNLDLPSKHPFCTNPEHTLLHPMSPPMGPSSDFEASTIWDAIVTAFLYHVPPATALAYLNAVLVAIYIAPMGLLVYLMRLFSLSRSDNSCKANASWKFQTELLFHSTLFFAWLVMTDDQYVMGIGRGFGAGLVGVLLVVAAAVAVLARDLSQPMFLHRVLLVLFVSSLVSPWGLLDADEIRTNVEPGLYYNHDNVLIRQTVDRWKTTLPDYASIATPWQWTGDARTGLPYLMNHPKAPNFHRVWLDTIDNEYVALDIAFPRGGHNTSNPLYLILHGLNGGSKEGYVLDLAASRTNAGSTVVVLVARGLMNTPIQGWTVRRMKENRWTLLPSSSSILRVLDAQNSSRHLMQFVSVMPTLPLWRYENESYKPIKLWQG